MGWQDRLKTASYASPGGLFLEFLYEDVSESFGKKTTAYEFPDFEGTFVQDLGRSGRRYPLRVIFSGDNYDTRADLFMLMLGETGIGQLVHPSYGLKSVVPFGDVTRTDRLKSAGNQATIAVTFYETTELLFPSDAVSPEDELEAALEAYSTAVSEEFAANVDIDTVVEVNALKAKYQAVSGAFKTGLQSVANATAKVQRRFDAVFKSINDGIDTFIRDPLNLASQTVVMLQTPARSIALIQDRLDAYGNQLSQVTSQALLTVTFDGQANNDFRSDDLLASNALAGSIASVLNNQFEFRSEALSAANQIQDQADEWTTWREDNIEALGITDDGEMYKQLKDAVAVAAGFLVQISFSLKQERIIVLGGPRTALDLEAELYGTVDENLDFLINTNRIGGDEFFEIPAGRSIRYYV